jgi:transcriptional regulator
VAVHARGAPRRLEEPERVRELLVRTAALFEAGAAEPWRLDAVPAEWAARMQRAIVAFELPIERLEGKAKLSQNKSAADRAGVVAGLRESGDAAAAALAAHMEALA